MFTCCPTTGYKKPRNLSRGSIFGDNQTITRIWCNIHFLFLESCGNPINLGFARSSAVHIRPRLLLVDARNFLQRREEKYPRIDIVCYEAGDVKV